MADINTSEVIVGTSATLLRQADADGSAVAISNDHGSTVYVGPAGVTVANGFPLATGSVLSLDLGPSAELYAVSASGSHAVRIMVAER